MKYPHEIGAAWPSGPVKIRVEAGAYFDLVLSAMTAWNEVLAPHRVALQPATRTRKALKPRLGDGENTIYLSTGTSFYADCTRRMKAGSIVEADIRVNPDRMGSLPTDRIRLILIHEIGHLLGWGHYDGPEDSITHTKMPFHITGITEFDKQAVDALYGRVAARAILLKQIAAARRITNIKQRNTRLTALKASLAHTF